MKRTIVCFGDSNTWGYDAISGQRFDEEARWTERLGRLLGDEYRVVEEGLCGRTSVCEDPLFEGLSGISYIYPCLMSQAPLELVVIMLGTNDTKERFGLTSYNMAQGIVRLALRAQNTPAGSSGVGPNVLVVAPPPIRAEYIHTEIGRPMGDRCSEKAHELGQHLEKLLAGTGIAYADAKNEVQMNEIDYMHLDEQGHRQMADFMHAHIRRVLA